MKPSSAAKIEKYRISISREEFYRLQNLLIENRKESDTALLRYLWIKNVEIESGLASPAFSTSPSQAQLLGFEDSRSLSKPVSVEQRRENAYIRWMKYPQIIGSEDLEDAMNHCLSQGLETSAVEKYFSSRGF